MTRLPAHDSLRSAFTLVELLTVVSIIAILLGMVGSASYAARQSSYKSQARAEVREIANACRAYWIASGGWDDGPFWPASGGEHTIQRGNALGKALTGSNPAKAVFLGLNAEEDEFCDPWGNPYHVRFEGTQQTQTTHHFSSSVTFPMRNRHAYYGRQFE